MVFTKSPTSAVSPPAEVIFIPNWFKFDITSSFPLIIFSIISPGISVLFLPIVDETTMFFVAPTHIKSSIFIIKES